MTGQAADSAACPDLRPDLHRTAGLDVAWPVNLLHIGKTGGTQLCQLGLEVNARLGVTVFINHKHAVRLGHLPDAASYAFSIRRPDARFRSAFYSRKRCGRPRFNTPWHAGEARAFAAFPHANDLAEALFDEGPRGDEARCAIEAINHTAMHQIDWFNGNGYFLYQRPPVHILRTEHFVQDWAVMTERLGLQDVAPPPEDDPVRAHRNDYAGTPPLSARAIANLNQWYHRDLMLYERCVDWLQAPPQLRVPPAPQPPPQP